uniref:Acetyltransf_18 domain-containing protein n=1 Tax=Rhabditophanes sp. KR3021 TaxID=114890 RepID=A0AC35TKW4_9BILA
MTTLPFDVLISPEDPKYYEKFYKSAFKNSGWMKSANDYDVWRTSFGEDYFFLAAIDRETKEHFGSVGGTFYRNNAGKRVIFCIGGFFLFPEFRGKGQGKPLFGVLLDIAKKEDVNIYLNCGDHMKDIYCSIGIDIIRKNYLIGYTPNYIHFNFEAAVFDDKSTLLDAKECPDWEKVKEFDQKIVGDINRINYLKTRAIQPTSHALISYDKVTNKVNGFANAYQATGGNLIFGPFNADSDEIAEQLFICLFKKLAASKVQIGKVLFVTFQANEFIVSLLKKYTNGRENRVFKKTSHFSKFDINVKTEFVYCLFETGLSFA